MTRTRSLALATFLLLLGFVELVVGLVRADLILLTAGDLGLLAVGWGTFLELLASAGSLAMQSHMAQTLAATVAPGAFELGRTHLVIGAAAWVAGWVLLSLTLRTPKQVEKTLSHAAGKALHPRLSNYVDFHWGTLAAYGFGFFLAEVGFIGVYLAVVGKGTVQGGVVQDGLAPVSAFLVAFFVAMFVAFAGGFIGAANSKRLSTPEATIALLYFGLPVPLILTIMHANSGLMLELGIKLREIVYLSSLLGENRPELGYWLVFLALALGFFLGINFGFVSTSSGRLDLRASYELFISARHVSVFRPRLLLGVFGVLILGIVPPLILWAFISAAEEVVERTRVRKLGLIDPLDAAAALNEVKLKAQSPTGMMTALSVGGVGVGVMALIIVLSVMSGFEADLQKKILGTNSHGVVMKYAPEMPEYEDVLGKVQQVRGIAGATPFILNEVMISSEGNISGAMIKGIDPKTVGTVTDLPEYLVPGGKLDWLTTPKDITHRRLAPSFDEPAFDGKPATPDEVTKPKKGESDIERDPLLELPDEDAADDVVMPGILLGRELAASLKVVVGDRVNVVSPVGGELGPQGPMPE